jgi:hypothetical protein
VTAFFKELDQQEGVKLAPGLNKRSREEGGDFFVAVGVAEISGHRSSEDWATSRASAFDKAMNDAKAEISAFIRSDIETLARQGLEENTAGLEPPAQSPGQGSPAAGPPSVLDRISRLTHEKLAEMLQKQATGSAAASSQRSAATADKLTRTEEFQNFVRTSSSAMVAGVQAFQSFEDLQSGRNGEVAVIGIVSDRTLALAASLGCGAALPKGKPGKPITDQVPDANTEDGALQLLTTFGVRTMYDENGDLTLVSFNQARPVNDSTGAELSAQRRAGTSAAGEIRRFMGEQIARVEDAFRSETAKDFEDNTRETLAKEGGRFAYEALAEKMSISGIRPVMDWTARHPITGQIIVGSVKMWSPSGKAFAGMLRGKMARAVAASNSPQGAIGAVSSGGRKPINSDQQGDSKGRGIKADKDAF